MPRTLVERAQAYLSASRAAGRDEISILNAMLAEIHAAPMAQRDVELFGLARFFLDDMRQLPATVTAILEALAPWCEKPETIVARAEAAIDDAIGGDAEFWDRVFGGRR